MLLIPADVKPLSSARHMQTEKLQRAIGAIHVRFGDQALMRANRLPPAQPWPTGRPGLDLLCRTGGLPRGRISVLQGAPGSGRLSLALALLAQATREFARVVVIDLEGGLDPWTVWRLGADLGAMTLIRPPTRVAAGEAAVALARAGAGWLLMLGDLPEPTLASLESGAARSGCVVIAVNGPMGVAGPQEAREALAFASSLTLELERIRWVKERGQVVGIRTHVTCVKNKLGASGSQVDMELRYPRGPRLAAGELWVVDSTERRTEAREEVMTVPWGSSAAG